MISKKYTAKRARFSTQTIKYLFKKKKTLDGPPSLKKLTNVSQKVAVVSTAILMEHLNVNSGLALV